MERTPYEGFHKLSFCQLWSSYLVGRSPTGVGTWSPGDWLPGFTGPYPSTTLDKKIGCHHSIQLWAEYIIGRSPSECFDPE